MSGFIELSLQTLDEILLTKYSLEEKEALLVCMPIRGDNPLQMWLYGVLFILDILRAITPMEKYLDPLADLIAKKDAAVARIEEWASQGHLEVREKSALIDHARTVFQSDKKQLLAPLCQLQVVDYAAIYAPLIAGLNASQPPAPSTSAAPRSTVIWKSCNGTLVSSDSNQEINIWTPRSSHQHSSNSNTENVFSNEPSAPAATSSSSKRKAPEKASNKQSVPESTSSTITRSSSSHKRSRETDHAGIVSGKSAEIVSEYTMFIARATAAQPTRSDASTRYLSILRALQLDERSVSFWEPAKTRYPYFTPMQCYPMLLSSVRRKVVTGEYVNHDQFAKEMRLVWAGNKSTNPNSRTNLLKEKFEDLLQRWVLAGDRPSNPDIYE